MDRKISFEKNDNGWVWRSLWVGKEFSNDRSTQTGAVITRNNELVIEAANSFPEGVQDLDSRHERPIKYDYIEHAERNAIYGAALAGLLLLGTTMYLPYCSPCCACARAIIQAGIFRVVAADLPFPGAGQGKHYNVKLTGMDLLSEAGVQVELLDMGDLFKEIAYGP